MADETQQDKRPKLVQAKPVSPEQRRLLQESFDKGEQSKLRNRDYATEMFAQCVAGDPGNPLYVQSFLDNLQKKYNNKGKGGNFAAIQGMGSKAKLKKSLAKGEFSIGDSRRTRIAQIESLGYSRADANGHRLGRPGLLRNRNSSI